MSAKIAKLEALLTRVHRRANEPRSRNSVETNGETSEELTLDSPSIIPPAGANPPLVELDEPDELGPDSLELDDVPESGSVPSQAEIPSYQVEDAPLTPPPESIEEEIPTQARPASAAPTMEQLGQTVDLDDGDAAPDLELDEPIIEMPESIDPVEEPAMVTDLEPKAVRREPMTASPLVLEGEQDRATAQSFAELVDSSLGL